MCAMNSILVETQSEKRTQSLAIARVRKDKSITVRNIYTYIYANYFLNPYGNGDGWVFVCSVYYPDCKNEVH